MNRGQPITFRIPPSTPDHILKYLEKLKEKERRNFSSTIAEIVIRGIGQSVAIEKETITIILPKSLSKVEKDWLKHEHSEALLGNIVYQLLTNPVRTSSILTAITGEYSQEDEVASTEEPDTSMRGIQKKRLVRQAKTRIIPLSEEDLAEFEWDNEPVEEVQEDQEDQEVEESMESLLGDFLSQMNK
ncbi:hypothetical protein [Bacillus sp. 2205SS5-2]|uniref:hypothetical protein n=1 Tax=Bacillus sp. 2205SS5-2 TaxID=3109031 RepID=UPI003007B01F